MQYNYLDMHPNLEMIWEECFETLRAGEPFALIKEDEVRCVNHFPIGAADRWELLFLPELAEVIYRSKKDNSPQRLSTISTGLLRGTLNSANSTMAAYGDVLTLLKGNRGLSVMRKQEVHLKKVLRTSIRLARYYEKRCTAPIHKSKVELPVSKGEETETDSDYHSLLSLLVSAFKNSKSITVLNQWDQLPVNFAKQINEENILQYVTAAIFLIISNIDLPQNLSEKKQNTCYMQCSELRMLVSEYLGIEKLGTNNIDEKPKEQEEHGQALMDAKFFYQLESREELEGRIPMKNRLKGDVASIDIAVLAGITLFNSKRHILDNALKAGIPVRFVMVDYKSVAASAVFTQFVDTSTDGEQNAIWDHAYSSAASKQNRFKNFQCRKTRLGLPSAIFIVHMKDKKESSAKIDFYSFDTNDDDRRCIYITGSDKENFEFYQRQFDYIWEHSEELCA
jgi:hypothetical protein